MDFWVEQTVAPTFTPVTLEEARLQLRFDEFDTSQDTLLAINIAAAAEQWERFTDRALAEQTLRITKIDGCYPYVDLPGGNLVSIGTVEVIDPDDPDGKAWTETTAYEVTDGRTPPRVTFADDTATGLGATFTGRVTYTCGYADVELIPQDYRLAVLQMVTFYYENAGDNAQQSHTADFSDALKSLLKSQHAGTTAGYWLADTPVP